MYQAPDVPEAKRGVMVLKKQQEAAEAQAMALVEMMKTSSPDVGGRIDVRA